MLAPGCAQDGKERKQNLRESLFSKDAASPADIYRLFFRKTLSSNTAH